MKKIIILFSIGCSFISLTSFAVALDYPCNKSVALFLTDRGSITDTPCVVPENRMLVEGGYGNQFLITGDTLQSYPQAEVALGLPAHSEVFISLPSYNRQNSIPLAAGSGPTTLGVKHEVLFGHSWTFSAQGLLVLPSGSANFGAPDVGGALNGMFGIDLTSSVSLAGMFGMSSTTEAIYVSGQRFNSLNLSIAPTFAPTETVTLFIELFGQTKTAVDLGGGLNGDFGFLYAYSQSLVFDAEVGQRFSGKLGGYNHYMGIGLTGLF